MFTEEFNKMTRLLDDLKKYGFNEKELYKLFSNYDWDLGLATFMKDKKEAIKELNERVKEGYNRTKNGDANNEGTIFEIEKDDDNPKTEEKTKECKSHKAKLLRHLNNVHIGDTWTIKGGYMEDFDKKNYKLEIVAPGYNEDDLQITITPTEGKLTITSKEKEDKKWYQPKISITEDLPETVDYTTFTKTLKNGILTIEAKMVEKPEEESFEI